jgi:uncharacterized membrane protein YbhN (UPF0104 family)
MSRLTSIGTIIVERVCDGVILVCALWITLVLVFPAQLAQRGSAASWIMIVAVVAALVFGAAFLMIACSHRIDISRFHLPRRVVDGWVRLVRGFAFPERQRAILVLVCSVGVWILEAVAVKSIVLGFGIALSVPQTLFLISLASLSTLLPTAPVYLGTYQFVFAQVFALFGYSESAGVVAATTTQIFCYGTITAAGFLVLCSRSGIILLRSLSVLGERKGP